MKARRALIGLWRATRQPTAIASSKVLFWMVSRALAQLLLLLLTSRALGPSDYGIYVTVVAIASLVVPFVGFGAHGPLMRDLARAPDQIVSLMKDALQWWALTLGLATVAVPFVIGLLLPKDIMLSPWILFLVIGSDLAAISLIELVGRMDQATGYVGRFGFISASIVILRLISAFVVWACVGMSLQGWLVAYGLMGYLYTLVLLTYVAQRVSIGRLNHPPGIKLKISDGAPFVIAGVSVRMQAEFNKPILAQRNLTDSGLYNIAQRAVDVLSLPLFAMQEAFWPRMYRARSLKEIRVHLMVLTVCAVFVGAAIYFSAAAVPILVGADFESTVPILRLLCFFPLVQLIKNLLGTWMAHKHEVNVLSVGYFIGALIGILSVTLMIPKWGVEGAVIAAYVGELSVVIFLMGASWARKNA